MLKFSIFAAEFNPLISYHWKFYSERKQSKIEFITFFQRRRQILTSYNVLMRRERPRVSRKEVKDVNCAQKHNY